MTGFTYDDLGRRITATNPQSQTSTFGYDALHRLISATDPGNLTASQAFDVDGNWTGLTNAASNTTTFGFDPGGRLTSITTPEGRAIGMTYNSRGLVATATEPSTQQTTFTYDDAMRLSSFTDAVGTVSMTRDAVGRVLTVTEGAKTLTREYDLLGRMTEFTDSDGNVFGYTYDDLGRLTTLTYPDLKEVNYTYTQAGHLHTVTDWANRVTTYTHDSVGRMTEVLRPNGTKQTRAYDAAGQLTQLREWAADGTTVLYAADDLTYSLAGRLLSETLTPAVAPLPYAAAQTFDLDNRLLTHNGASTTFDADGNLLSIASGIAPASYTYDARNRLTAAGGLTYTYDAEDRRVAVTDGVGTTSYAVSPHTALSQTLVRTAPGGTKTFYVYGLGLIHEETGTDVRYYHHDRRGDTVMLTDGTGAVTDRVAYGIFGEIVSRTGTTDTPFLFSGLWGVQTDANEIYYHRSRYYHPGLRRFLNQDFVLGAIASPASMNRFAYANGNPVSLIDPFGLAAQDLAPNNAQLQQAIAIRDRYEGYFAKDGQYASMFSEISNLRDPLSLAALAGSLSAAANAARLAPTDLKGIFIDAYGGVTYYPNRAGHWGRAGNALGVVAAGMDGFSLGVAINQGDGSAAFLSSGNIAVDLTAAAAGGPIGLGLAGGQLLVNGSLYLYSSYQNYQDYVNTLNSAAMAAATLQKANETVARLQSGNGGGP